MYALSKNRMNSVLPSGDFWNGFFDDLLDTRKTISSSPRMKISEDDDKLVLNAELPGLRADDIDIVYEDSVLTLKTKTKEEEKKKEENVIFNEMREISFSRSFRIEGVDADNISANLKDGILTLEMVKNKDSKKRKIKVN
jgi:HSP20 family protein